MKAGVVCAALTLCVAAVMCFAADDPQMGTWKLNEGKSKIAAGNPKNSMVVYTADGDNIKVTVDGSDPDGKPVHSEWTGKFDGNDYAVTGDSTSDSRSYKKINARTMAITAKKGGKVTLRGRIVVSADGKSRTVTTSGTDAKGKKFSNTAFYDKS
ncbi:MAG TPA: hypothetical protein VG498_26780 [Terriglobales bacterium]|nr:hypothetical protein [Terriglobales bacterium]